MLMRILKKPYERSNYSKNLCLYTPSFPETTSLERVELTLRFLHFSDNWVLSEHEWPANVPTFTQKFNK